MKEIKLHVQTDENWGFEDDTKDRDLSEKQIENGEQESTTNQRAVDIVSV
jgi:hypothetical protein